MKTLVFCTFLLASVRSTSFGTTSVVLTAKDLYEGNADKLTLIDGAKYRVYAVYASTLPNDSFMKSVIIKGADGTQFTVADLAKPKTNTEYVLDENKILRAPITISFSSSTSVIPLGPLTIYIVSEDKPVSPVISAQLVNGAVDCSLAKVTASSCTVLSAEMAFELSELEFIRSGTYSNCDEVSATGFDSHESVLSCLENDGTFVTISGPIATVVSDGSADIRFNLRRDAVWSGSLLPHARTTFLSNGWLSEKESYNVDYRNDYVLMRNYDFGKQTNTQLYTYLGNTGAADSIQFTCTQEKGDRVLTGCISEYFFLDDMTWCSSILLNVTTKDEGGLRFKFLITSGTRSLSVIALLVVTFFSGIQ